MISPEKKNPTVAIEWEEFCILRNIDYATLIGFSDWMNNYPRSCENLDPQPKTPFTGGSNFKDQFKNNKEFNHRKETKFFISAQRKTS